MIYLILVLVLVISVITDLRSRKILNIVVFPAICLGLIFNTIFLGFDGFLFASKGLLVGLSLLFIPFVLGGIGAGDVKLLGAIGSLLGTSFVFNTFIYTAIFGGIIAFYILVRKKEIKNFIQRAMLTTVLLKETNGSLSLVNKKDLAPSFPYGVSIALGAVCTLISGGIL